MDAFEHIKVGRLADLPSVAEVVLNRPDAGNAMSDKTLRELTQAFRALSEDAGLRAVLVTGAGKHFCAGADIEWMRRAGRLAVTEGKMDARLLFHMLSAVRNCPAPVVVAAHGAVYGGGLGLAAACDIALAADDAKFCFSECRLGIMPAVISFFVLPKIGERAARRYYLTSEVFRAAEAREMGLVHEALPAAELGGRARSLIGEILKNGPLAVRAAKDLILRFDGWTPAQRVDKAVATLVRLRSGLEGQEGLGAFLEKRKPSWVK